MLSTNCNVVIFGDFAKDVQRYSMFLRNQLDGLLWAMLITSCSPRSIPVPYVSVRPYGVAYVSCLVCGATKGDASTIGFDEKPVFEASYEHLRSAGIVGKREVLRDEAACALREYGEIGVIYNIVMLID
mmetsp:Transcript_16002/g.23576  ORF Transcript_16002/g.23576 Transcript_16002/m.23576 type:complete len:129 (+) Transcript_16002:1773-2159(+)